MAKWLERHWKGTAGVVASASFALVYANGLFEWAEHLDFIGRHMGGLITALSTVPGFVRLHHDPFVFLGFLGGLALIAWDYRTVKDPPKLERGDWRDTWAAMYKLCPHEDYIAMAKAVDAISDNTKLQRDLRKQIMDRKDPRGFGGDNLTQLQFELNRALGDAERLEDDCARTKRSAIATLTGKLVRGEVLAKAFRKPYSDSDSMRAIPAEHWNVLQFDLDDPLLQTVSADDIAYAGLLVRFA